MTRLLKLMSLVAFGAVLAMADLLGNGSGITPGPNDPYIFGYSNANGGTPVDLILTDGLGNQYTYTTSFDEIITGYTNSGWWSPTQSNGDSNSNYIAQQSDVSENDYFTFNMGQNVVSSGATSPEIVSATLSIPTNLGFCTPEPDCETDGLPVTYSVGAVSVDADTLADKGAGSNATIYADLGVGNYGSVYVGTIADYTDPLNITLDAAAVSDLNAVLNSSDYFSIGGTLTPAAVPEPISLLLLGTIAPVLLLKIRRKGRS
jgi:hypothetical protein